MRIKKLRGKNFSIKSMDFKAYERIFDPLATIACIYEHNNKIKYC